MLNGRPSALRVDQVGHRPDGSRGFKTTWLARLGGINIQAPDGRWQFDSPVEARAAASACRRRLIDESVTA